MRFNVLKACGVAADILLTAIGTNMTVDAINDLSRR